MVVVWRWSCKYEAREDDGGASTTRLPSSHGGAGLSPLISNHDTGTLLLLLFRSLFLGGGW